ncbi:MAG: DUF2282 domain-containing protein [Rhodospirillaceae bacterium]|nr:DUF2282 domain-containing protein [Rhodospirillaceae bacterium]
MIKMNKLLIASAISAAFALSACTTTDNKAHMEKCMGIAKKGMNDCKTALHACAGKSTADKQATDWIWLPEGTCAKTGGKLNR